jgi:hypothetical protein
VTGFKLVYVQQTENMPELCKTLSFARMMRHTLDFSWLVFSVQKTNVSNNYSAVSRVTMNPESKGSFLDK